LQGALKPEEGIFTGILPDKENIANTAVEWSGLHWTQMVWPLPNDVGPRKILMIHELFHRIQNRLALPRLRGGDNQHLDTREGRFYLQLEWRALERALEAANEVDRKSAIADALLFRLTRYSLFPDAAVQEQALELDEGLAEYTGIKIACCSATDQTRAAIHDLTVHRSDPSFVRSFAYATGPAYGLLLDSYVPRWRKEIVKEQTFMSLLTHTLALAPPADIEASSKIRAISYDGGVLWQEESQRDTKRKDFIQECRSRFVNGPVLVLPQHHMSVQFDPRNLQPLEGYGIFYPSLRVTDDWGILEVNNGALMKTNRSAVVVEAPPTIAGKSLQGNGWTLKLSAEWNIVPGVRKGDYLLRKGDDQDGSKSDRSIVK
jgi:hypothetical protein